MRTRTSLALFLCLFGLGNLMSGCFCMFDNSCFDHGDDDPPIARPPSCPNDYEPVCGEDDVTYRNECFASAYNVAIESYGVCASAETCDAEQYDPMCGENGITYFSACEARDAGIALAYPGECLPSEEPVCGAVYSPVCGVDGRTYMNECEALHAGAAVQNVGECEQLAPQCLSDSECNEGERCVVEISVSNTEPSEDGDAGAEAGTDPPRGLCQPVPADDPCAAVACEEGTHCIARQVHFGLPCDEDAGSECAGRAWIGLCAPNEA